MSAIANPTIVLATDSLAPSGVGEHMLTLADALRHDHRMVLAFPDASGGESFLSRARKSGCETLPIASDGASIAGPLRDLCPAVLHVHAGVGWEGHGLANAGWLAGIPVIRTEHLPYVLTDADQKREHLLGIGMVERTIFVSHAAHETFRKAGASGSRAVTIRNGIARPRPSNGSALTRTSIGIGDGDVVIVTIARFTPQKGYAFLLNAASEVLAQHPDVRFLLIGDGPERPEMAALADDLGMGTSVRFLGERDDVADLLAAADIFVLPSLFEGLPLVVLEAMALGVSVVATRIGGTSEALGADYPWLVEPGSATALAGMLSVALKDREMRARLGERNGQRYAAEFRSERMAAETAALYRAVVAEGSCRA
jgi:glycosyltransferase involved in cell wall biosynthesis